MAQAILELLKSKGVKIDDFEQEIVTAYETEVTGLKKNRDDLIAEKRKLAERATHSDPEASKKLYDLEDQLSTSKAELELTKQKFERELQKAQKAAQEFAAKFEGVSTAHKTMLKDAALSEAFAKAQITDPVLSKVLKSHLSGMIDVIEEADGVKVIGRGEKGVMPVTEFVSAFALTEEGQRFVSAPRNTGSGSVGATKVGPESLEAKYQAAQAAGDVQAMFAIKSQLARVAK